VSLNFLPKNMYFRKITECLDGKKFYVNPYPVNVENMVSFS